MRLEKMVYERVINSKILGRSREMAKPSRVHYNTEFFLRVTPALGINKLLAPVGRWLLSMEWKYMYGCAQQRGLAVEDFFMFTGPEMRRDPLFEHVMRESMNPFMFNMYRWRRERYFKVDNAVRGFEAPQYLKEEARKRTYIDSFANMHKFRHFLHHNYTNDTTPKTYRFVGYAFIFELFIFNNMLTRNAWTRYFFNEKHYYTTDTYLQECKDAGYKPLDFSDDKDWEVYKTNAVKHNRDFPGWLAPAGEDVDFVHLRKVFEEIKKEFGFEKLTSHDINTIGMRNKCDKIAFVQPSYEGEDTKGTNNIGVDEPKHIKKCDARSFFN